MLVADALLAKISQCEHQHFDYRIPQELMSLQFGFSCYVMKCEQFDYFMTSGGANFCLQETKS